MSTSAWFPRTSAALVGLVSLLGAGACVVPAPFLLVSPDAGEPDGEAPIPTISVRGSKKAIGVRDSSLEIQRPDDVAAGDVLLAHISKRNDIEAEVTLAGWERIRDDHSDALLNSWLLWKVARDDEQDVYAFEISGKPDNAAGIIVAVVGADPMDPIDAEDGKLVGRSKDDPGRAQEFGTPMLNTDASEGLAVWFGAQVYVERECPIDPITPPEGFTHIDGACIENYSTGILLEAARQQLGEAGQQPPLTGRSRYDQTNIAQAVALRPAAESTAAADRGASTPAP